ncbi:MAG: hypothetical protein P1V21_14365 [Rhizobiaceae bacterium]|nr:hypothetical protein [Rhizobiaceae bacterium]
MATDQEIAIEVERLGLLAKFNKISAGVMSSAASLKLENEAPCALSCQREGWRCLGASFSPVW